MVAARKRRPPVWPRGAGPRRHGCGREQRAGEPSRIAANTSGLNAAARASRRRLPAGNHLCRDERGVHERARRQLRGPQRSSNGTARLQSTARRRGSARRSAFAWAPDVYRGRFGGREAGSGGQTNRVSHRSPPPAPSWTRPVCACHVCQIIRFKRKRCGADRHARPQPALDGAWDARISGVQIVCDRISARAAPTTQACVRELAQV